MHPSSTAEQRSAQVEDQPAAGVDLVVPLRGLEQWALPLVGGKAAKLGALLGAGFAVPDGFCVTTAAYDAVRALSGLDPLLARLATHPAADAAGLAALAQAIRTAVLRTAVPPALVQAITAAYAALEAGGAAAVAVRSSATAEDLPDASFAGQQDTLLNVVGTDAVRDAVQRCWASLWSDRAVSYRAQRGIDPRTVSIAVVVQRMVAATVAGVLFTANPVSGKRREAIIEAVAGLGEALVSGATAPDHLVVASTGAIVERRQGEQHSEAAAGPTPARTLADSEVRTLVAQGRRVEAVFGAPQDIEWAIDGADRVWLLQARPITTLFPLPPDAPATDDVLRVYLCFNMQQGTTQPFTPLGLSALRRLAAAITTTIGVPVTDPAQGPRFVTDAAGRLLVDVTGALRTTLGRTILTRVLADTEPQAALLFEQVVADERLSLRPFSLRTFGWTVARLLVRTRALVYVLQALVAPAAARARVGRLERRIRHTAPIADDARAEEHLAAIERLLDETPRLLFGASPVMLAGMLSVALARRLLGDLAADAEIQRTLGGTPGNVTTDMTLALGALAAQIDADATTRTAVTATPPAELAAAYRAGQLPPVLQRGLADLLATYGHRSLAEFDLGVARWADDPTYLLAILAGFLEAGQDAPTPDAQVRRAAAAGEAMVAALTARAARRSPVRGLLVKLCLQRVRALNGMRELPRFLLALRLAQAWQRLQPVGDRLHAAGRLVDPYDLAFLSLPELHGALAGVDLRMCIAERRAAYVQELQRRLVPLVLLSDGTIPTVALPDAATAPDVLQGTAASPGRVSGVARVLDDAHGAALRPGEILVARAADPSWTPLFPTAAGLVTEVGGAMAHGAIVAREYGIPAVVGVAGATARIATGQRITVDGNTGTVSLAEQSAP